MRFMLVSLAHTFSSQHTLEGAFDVAFHMHACLQCPQRSPFAFTPVEPLAYTYTRTQLNETVARWRHHGHRDSNMPYNACPHV